MNEPPLWQFWWNWAVQFGTAVGTILAVIVALFGGLLPPRLRLSLQDARGVPSPCVLTSPDGTQRQSESRWYHVKVKNNTRIISSATQTQVLMLEIQEPNAAGEMISIWRGAMPLKWRSLGYLPFGKTVGYEGECDLCSVVKDGWVELHPVIDEFAMKRQRTTEFRIVVVLQAHSDRAASNVLRVGISWDGKWSDDTDQMARHLVIKPL